MNDIGDACHKRLPVPLGGDMKWSMSEDTIREFGESMFMWKDMNGNLMTPLRRMIVKLTAGMQPKVREPEGESKSLHFFPDFKYSSIQLSMFIYTFLHIDKIPCTV